MARYPYRIADDGYRCDAIAKPVDWIFQNWGHREQLERHRCFHKGTSFRRGRLVCHIHAEQPNPTFVKGNRFDAMAAAWRGFFGENDT